MAKKSKSPEPGRPVVQRPPWQSQTAAQSIAAAEARLRGQSA